MGDIRDLDAVRRAMAAARPEVVLHLAAQPLVRLSYAEPVATYATNVMGTVHVLEAARGLDGVRAIVNVTTDKCYENREWVWGYREDEPMGGYDPYSNSKGCSELVTSAYRRSFLGTPRRRGARLGARRQRHRRRRLGRRPAGARHPARLRARRAGRHPQPARDAAVAARAGAARRLPGARRAAVPTTARPSAEACNFGPREDDARPVQWIVERLAERWGDGARWQIDAGEHPHEAHYLKLDISKARHRLGWQPRWGLATALDRIVGWHRAWLAGDDMRALCLAQIADYTTHPTKETEPA